MVNRLSLFSFKDFAPNMQAAILNERLRMIINYKKLFQKNKKEIKDELLRLGIDVKPGTCLSKLLSMYYLPIE
jgi:hypothetical protein